MAIHWVLLICLALSALTLLFPSTPTYDPWAWLLWGREITHLDLVTDGGPSWKPLPVMFNVPFSLFGADAAPYLWLWIARAGALLALAMSFRLGAPPGRPRRGRGRGRRLRRRLPADHLPVRARRGAGQLRGAAGRRCSCGPSSATWTAAATTRSTSGLACALLRPEVWPFLGLYGLWLFVREPEMRLQGRRWSAWPSRCSGSGPELWGSGEPFRASSRAGKPNPGSAAFADHPGLEVAKRFAERAVIPLQVAGFVAVIVAGLAWVRHRAQGAILALAGIGIAWILLVAVMTERGYAGNQRYLIVTTAALCVLGGIGIGRIFDGIREAVAGTDQRAHRPAGGLRRVRASACVALSPVIKAKVENVDKTLDKLRYEASLWHTLPGVIDEAGGPTKLLACGNVYSGPFQTQMVAYQLGVHGINVGDVRPLKESPAPGAIFRTHTVPGGPLVAAVTDQRFREVSPLRALADLDRAAGRRPRAQLPRRGHRRTPCPSDRAHDRAVVLALTIFP